MFVEESDRVEREEGKEEGNNEMVEEERNDKNR